MGVASGLWTNARDLADYQATTKTRIPLTLDASGDLFRAYHVEAVPTYVAASTSFALCAAPDCASEPTPFDRLAGNVTTGFALETFADGNGPGSPVARLALKNLRSGD